MSDKPNYNKDFFEELNYNKNKYFLEKLNYNKDFFEGFDHAIQYLATHFSAHQSVESTMFRLKLHLKHLKEEREEEKNE